MFVTRHCEDRVRTRLAGVVSLGEVCACVEGLSPKVGETWVLVKKLQHSVYIPCNTADGAVNGDTVWAVVKLRPGEREPALVTVLVRRWGQRIKADHVIGR